MSKSAKEIVRNFYLSRVLTDKTILQTYFHPEIVLIWNSSAGLSIMHYEDLENLDHTQTYLIYCRSGRRSLRTCVLMQNSGFGNVFNLEEGLQAFEF